MKYDILVSKESVEKTMQALTERGHLPEFIESRAQALARIKELIPTDASVMNGSSRTLEEIGFVQYLKDGEHGWNNLHEAILSEKDPAAQAMLRKQSVLSDYYLGGPPPMQGRGEKASPPNQA